MGPTSLFQQSISWNGRFLWYCKILTTSHFPEMLLAYRKNESWVHSCGILALFEKYSLIPWYSKMSTTNHFPKMLLAYQKNGSRGDPWRIVYSLVGSTFVMSCCGVMAHRKHINEDLRVHLNMLENGNCWVNCTYQDMVDFSSVILI